MSSLLKALGLQTFNNNLGDVSPGALIEATNVVIDRPGVIEPRRGFNDYGSAFPNVDDRAKQELVYKGRILRHYFDTNNSENLLQFDSDGNGIFSTFSGTYNETETGLRIKGQEANGNFYFTTDDGIKKISATSASTFTTASNYISDAGGVNALDTKATINYSQSGFFVAASKVAYRVVWGIKDINNNVILGGPSSSITVTNFSLTKDAVVDLQFAVPNRVNNTNYFYQIYRTAITTAPTPTTLEINALEPGDEMNLVLESQVTSAQLATGIIQETDITPEDFRNGGAPLYTNPVTGDGITQANNEPPLAKDITLFKGSTFYSNTKTKHRKFLNLLTVNDFISGSSKLAVSNGVAFSTYIFRGQEKIAKLTAVADVSDSLNGKYFLISSANNAVQYYVFFKTSGGVLTDPAISGRLGIEVDFTTGSTAAQVATAINTKLNTTSDFMSSISTATLSITNASTGYANDIQDGNSGFTFTNTGAGTQAGQGESLTGSISANTAANPTVITSTNHKLFTGDEIIISGSNSTPSINGTYTITRTGTNTFTIPVTVSVAGTSGTWVESKNYILISNLPTVGQQVDETARSIVNVINKDSSSTIEAFYLSGPSDVPGEILLQSKTLQDISFFLGVNSSSVGDNFNPILPAYVAITAISIANPTHVTATSHGLTTGNEVAIFSTNSTPNVDGVLIATVLDANTFTVPIDVTVSGNAGFVFLASEGSDNEITPNRLFFSKYQQPEAVPLVNFFDIGKKDAAIQRILALRDSLFILKEDGVFRLSGTSTADFSVTLFDGTCEIVAPDTASTLNNQIFMLAKDGVNIVTDTGISNGSRDIENLIYDAITFQHTFYKTASFGIGYQVDHAYLLFLPTNTTDAVATQCFRYNIFTSAWTKFDLTCTCAVVNTDNEKLNIGLGDRNYTQQERKDRTNSDYSDREISISINTNSIDGVDVGVSTVSDVDDGDMLSQTQYLTISEYNILLNQLDLDFLINDPTYFSSLEAVAGVSLRSSVDDLAAKLDTEPGLDGNYVASLVGTNTFPVIQSDFNIIVNKLNADAGVFFINYDTSTNTKIIEMNIETFDIQTNSVTLRYSMPFIAGPVSLLKGIPTTIQWAPQHFGDPSTLKQVKETTIIFDRNTFTNGTVSYSSDLNSVFDSINFEFPGPGNWGRFIWSNINWGGNGNSIPLRTLVPLEKQRCRFINVKFEHVNAKEKFSVLGISLEPRLLSTKAYR